MKKFIFGALIFVSGLIGILVFISSTVAANYVSLLDFLNGSHMAGLFVLFCILAIAGFAICLYEAYIKI